MACKIEELLGKLEKHKNNGEVAKLIDLVTQIKEIKERQNGKINIEVTKQSSRLDNEYTKIFRDVADKLVEYTMKEDNKPLIDSITRTIDKIVPANYDVRTKEITVPLPSVQKYIDKLVKEGKAAKPIELYSMAALRRILSEESVQEVIQTKEYIDAVNAAIKDREKNIKEAVFAIDMNQVTVHELVHAATYTFLEKINKNAKEKAIEDRLNRLFNEAKKVMNVDKMEVKPYWAKNIHEFVAESISNPEVIKMLDGIQIKLDGKLSSVLRAIVDAMVSIISTDKNKDSIYKYTLDGVIAVIENESGVEEFNINSMLTPDSKKLPKEYYNKLNKIVRKLIGPKVTTSKVLGLSQSVLENISLIGGNYAKKQNKVTLSKKPRQEALEAQSKDMLQQWWTTDSPYAKEYQNLDDKEFVEKLDSDKQLTKFIEDNTKGLTSMLLQEYAKLNGMHTLAHEMVHVGAMEYMKANPTSEETRRIKKLYKIALNNKVKILGAMGEGRNEYWTTNLDEFVAEGLSNPDLVHALNTIPVEGIGERKTTIFKKLLENLVNLLGFSNKDTVYTYLLDGYLRMMESRPNVSEVGKMLDNVREQYQKDIKLSQAKSSTRFSDIGINEYATPLIRELVKSSKVKIKEKDISTIQISKYLYENAIFLLSGRTKLMSAKDAYSNKVNGGYNPSTNTILLPGNKNEVNKELIGAVDSAIKELERRSGESILSRVKETENYKEIQKFVDEIVGMRQYDIAHSMDKKVLKETLLHELVHAITLTTLTTKEGLESREGKALEKIREVVTPILMKNKVLAEDNTYWQTDLSEFVAEAISNPELIRELAKIPVRNKKNLLMVVLDIVAGWFGKHKESVLEALLYQVGKIAEKQGSSKELVDMLTKAKINTTNDIIENILECEGK